MIMRTILTIIFLAMLTVPGHSQVSEDFPIYPVPEKYRLKGGAGLPTKVDNSQSIYFPAVFNQYGYSCNQASSIGYVFTYEINRLRQVPSDSPETLYTPGFVWNLLNSSNWGVGVSYFDSWEVVKAAGCPNYIDYPFYMSATGVWMSGYEKYYRAMQNRISLNYSMPVGTPEGLAIFKQYLYDHFEDSPVGGVASFQISSDRMDTRMWTDPESGEQWPVIWTFGNNVGHAMTFVGYNDSVRVDLNNDGRFTNDEDNNGDGVVDMKDWEVGALLAVNSWGQGWERGGKAYVMYSVVAREGNDGGIWNRSVHVIKAEKEYNPELTMRVVMRHEQRNRFRIRAGFSTDTTADRPQQTMSFPIFDYQGDDTPLEDPENPEDPKRFEFGLDITPFISSLDPGVPVKFFLIVDENDPNGLASGRIDEFSVIQYETGKDETVSDWTDVDVVNNGTTFIPLVKTLSFNKLKVEKPAVTNVSVGQVFYAQLSASGGQPPYRWELVKDYRESTASIDYTDISGDTLSDFDHEVPFQRVSLPFEFPFYGKTYNSIVVDMRGAIYFDNEYVQYPYVVNPDLIFKVRKSIVPFGADVQINVPGDILMYQPTDSVVTIEWKASVYTGLKVYPVSFKARLYPDGEIRFLYGRRSLPPGGDYPWQAGISNGDQSLYKYASISQNQLNVENYQITFTPADYPDNLVLSSDGTLSGIASRDNYIWNILVKVTDDYNQVKYATVPISTVTNDSVPISSLSYPNPFKRSTAISFKVGQESQVMLDIYDYSGRRVRELLNRSLLPGDFTIYWNARDMSNRDVIPGMYIYRLKVGGEVQTGKLILLK
jgi:hypothetical protein